MSPARIGVVGGGLAGMAAALSAADGGAEVVLFERRGVLGGLTSSIRRNGLSFDNGQHLFMRCCTAYLSFLERIEATEQVFLQRRLDVPVLAPSGRRSSIRRTALPAPLHLAGALGRYGHLSLIERARLLAPVLAISRFDPDDPSLDAIAFGRWLSERGQSERAIDHLWNLIVAATVNVPVAEASLAMATKVLRTGLLDSSAAGDIGWSVVPLSEIHGAMPARGLEAAGVETVLGEPVRGVSRLPAGTFAIRAGERAEVVDAVVVATPLRQAAVLGAFDREADLERLGLSPIVNVHLVLDRKVTDLALVACIDSPLQFVFDRSSVERDRLGAVPRPLPLGGGQLHRPRFRRAREHLFRGAGRDLPPRRVRPVSSTPS